MRKKVIWAFSLILFLLTSCTMLSLRVEELMKPEVINTSAVNRYGQKAALPLDCLKTDGTGMHLYSSGEGAGWEKGRRVYEIQPSGYMISDGRIVLEYGSGDIVHYVSKPPRVGELIRKVSLDKVENDNWLIVSAGELPDMAELPENASLEETSGGAALLSITGVSTPFMEDKARTELFGAESVLSAMEGEKYSIYSLGEVGKFLDGLIALAAIGAAIIGPALLWALSFPMIRKPKKYAAPIAVNAGISAAALGVMAVLLKRFTLPSCLLPKDSIVDIGHFGREFSQIFPALRSFTGGGAEAAGAVLAQAQSARLTAVIILAAAAAACVLLTALEYRLCRPRT